jgi:hypothetical protein
MYQPGRTRAPRRQVIQVAIRGEADASVDLPPKIQKHDGVALRQRELAVGRESRNVLCERELRHAILDALLPPHVHRVHCRPVHVDRQLHAHHLGAVLGLAPTKARRASKLVADAFIVLSHTPRQHTRSQNLQKQVGLGDARHVVARHQAARLRQQPLVRSYAIEARYLGHISFARHRHKRSTHAFRQHAHITVVPVSSSRPPFL